MDKKKRYEKEKEYDAFVDAINKQHEKNEKFESLKRKYFWEQKSKEIAKGFIMLVIWLSIASLLFNYLIYPEYLKGTKVDPFEPYALSGILSLGIIALLYLFYSLISWWIQANWEEADERAEEELKK